MYRDNEWKRVKRERSIIQFLNCSYVKIVWISIIYLKFSLKIACFNVEALQFKSDRGMCFPEAKKH